MLVAGKTGPLVDSDSGLIVFKALRGGKFSRRFLLRGVRPHRAERFMDDESKFYDSDDNALLVA
jgi:hypothetical protein